jgi:hypothetical protein
VRRARRTSTGHLSIRRPGPSSNAASASSAAGHPRPSVLGWLGIGHASTISPTSPSSTETHAAGTNASGASDPRQCNPTITHFAASGPVLKKGSERLERAMRNSEPPSVLVPADQTRGSSRAHQFPETSGRPDRGSPRRRLGTRRHPGSTIPTHRQSGARASPCITHLAATGFAGCVRTLGRPPSSVD